MAVHDTIHLSKPMCVVCVFNHVQFFAIPWTIATTPPPPRNRLLSPWNFPGKNTEVGCNFLLQGIFLAQGSNLHLLHQQMNSLPLALHENLHGRGRCSEPVFAQRRCGPNAPGPAQGCVRGRVFSKGRCDKSTHEFCYILELVLLYKYIE